MEVLALITVPLVVIAVWFGILKLASATCSYPQRQRICLLIAHADDEAMFSSPTVIRLANPTYKNGFEINCLSKGEDPDLRTTRSRELLLSATNLGLRSSTDVTINDDEEAFPDSMTTYWSPEDVAKVLAAKYQQDSAGHQPDLDILMTFDSHGISSHANHISLLHGAIHWLESMSQDSRDKVYLYSLTTTNMIRMYVSILDMPLTSLMYFWRSAGGSKGSDGFPERLLMFNGLSAYRKAQRSMTTCHRSQMLWFRYGWIMLSRYLSMNDLYRPRV